jgi:hypothetical protein
LISIDLFHHHIIFHLNLMLQTKHFMKIVRKKEDFSLISSTHLYSYKSSMRLIAEKLAEEISTFLSHSSTTSTSLQLLYSLLQLKFVCAITCQASRDKSHFLDPNGVHVSLLELLHFLFQHFSNSSQFRLLKN